MMKNFMNVGRTFALTVSLVFVFVLTAGKASAIEIQEVKSKSGVTAWLVEDRTVPLIAIKFSFKGGAASDPAGKGGLANFLSGMLDEGAGDLPSQAFQQQIADLSIKLSFDASRDRFSGSLQTLSANRDAAFELLRLALTKPRFDAAPLERIRNQLIVGIQRDKQKPNTIAGRNLVKTLVGDHAYANPVDGTINSVEAITRDDLVQLTKRLFARNSLKVAVTGDIDAATLKDALDHIFGGLAEKSGVKLPPMANVSRKGGIRVIDLAVPQSTILFGHRGPLRHDKDFVPAYVMNFILGGGGFGSRLMEEVREKRGLAYSAYAYLNPLDYAGFVLGGTATVNARVSDTIGVVKKEIARMAKDGPTKEELDAAISYLTGAYPLRFDTNAKIASQLHGNMVSNLGIDYVKKRNDLVRAVTMADVKRVAREVLKPDELLFIVVGQPKGVTTTN